MITQEQLLQVKELASLFFTVEQISLLTRVDKELLKREITFGSGELNQAYWSGKLGREKDIRKELFDFAKKGSPQALEQVITHLEEMNESEQ